MNKQEFDALVKKHKVLLFMKGTPDEPQCGFSAQVVHILRQLNIDFETFDVLTADKEALKEYSDWPTFPQLWVKGKLIGGCDIIIELADNGELEKLF